MIRLEIKNWNTMLIENQKKHQYYHRVKLENMNILYVKKLSFNQSKMIEQANFTLKITRS